MSLVSNIKNMSRRRIALWSAGIAGGVIVAGALSVGIAVAVVARQLPDVSALADYHPKLPLRVYTSEGVLIGEFGEERRELVPLSAMPKSLKDAVIATEDARFYEHPGIDAKGLLRALLANMKSGLHQGASTITMQVARNVYLSSERTYSRKLSEVVLAYRLEHALSKDQILEIYLNQIYLGQRAYGFAAAAQTYFGKPLAEITLAQSAMLAGLPKAPGANNPVVNPRRARARQLYVIDRMQEVGVIDAAQATAAKEEAPQLRDGAADPTALHAEHVAESVRQTMYAQYGDSIYTRGFKVTTTLVASEQAAAVQSLRKGLLDYERRQPWRGPEKFVDLPSDPKELDEAVDDALDERADYGDVLAVVVLEAGPREVTAVRANGDIVRITGEGLRLAQPGLSARAAQNVQVRRGAVIRVAKGFKGAWEITQLPEVEGAFVSLDPRDGAVRALVGGFDFRKSKFNHVTQAWRQPGSSFKPFIYSAALEKGFTPDTMVDDAPLFFDRDATGSQPWRPKNFDGGFDGPMTLRHALAQSKNMVTIRVLQSIGPQVAQDWIGNFGFDREKHPAYLPMALGAGSVTPMQMASAYAVFANVGLRVAPTVITRITDHKDAVLQESPALPPDESARAIPERNAFVMRSMLHSVMTDGTGAKARQALRRDDLFGKTGTTNDSVDTWFAGFQPTRVAIAWIGYDTPRQLGVRGETGGSLSLPIWSAYMKSALQGVAVARETSAPAGLANVEGEWYYDEFTPGHGIASLGLDGAPVVPVEAVAGSAIGAPASEQERRSILDWFR